ncbi:MAG TPA: PAS domain S-box protein [Tepidiformaceae bacterium]|nr:PAS domain S-box protein [Tepidiformaceae bacterium]
MNRFHGLVIHREQALAGALLLGAFAYFVINLAAAIFDWRPAALLDAVLTVGFFLAIVVGSFLLGKRVRALQRLSDESLAESERKLKLVADGTSDVISRVDRHGVVRYVSPASLRVFGYPPDELVERNVVDLIHPSDMPALAAFVECLAAEGGSGMMAYRVRKASGDYAWVETTFSSDVDPVTGEYLELHAVSRDISQRRAQEEELARQAAYLRAIIDTVPDAIIVADPTGTVLIANPAARGFLGDITGAPPEAAVQHSGLFRADGVTPATQDDVPMGRALAGETVEGTELVIRNSLHPEGRLTRGSARPIALRDGTVVGGLATFRDITDLRRRDLELQQLAAVVASASEAISVCDLDGILISWNAGAERLYGYRADEVIGSHVADLSPGATYEGVREQLARVRAGETFPETELRVTHKDGHVIDVALTYSIVGDPESDSVRIATIARDITDRRTAERELRESEDRYRRLAEATSEGVAIHDNGTIIDCNVAYARMFGYASPVDIIGTNLANLPAPQSTTDLFANIHSGNEGSIEVLAGRKDGSTFPIELRGATRQLHGRDVRIIVVRDLTQRKALEQERLDIERALAEAQRQESLAVLAGGVAHDFNNLLLAILGNAALATEMLPGDSELRPLLADIDAAGRRASDLARKMLAYSGRGRFSVEPVNIDAMVEEMIHLLRVTLSRSLEFDLQLQARAHPTEGDPTELRQVVMNLVMNAAEAIGDNPGRIAVSTGITDLGPDDTSGDLEPGTYLILTVQDDGPGMDEATRARAFDPFFSTKFTGRGLGLAAVAGIIRGHNGAIRVESSPGNGATFRVFLPVASRAADAAPPSPDQPEPTSAILLVDDEPITRDVTARMLRAQGYRVVLATDTVEALALLSDARRRIGLVILDGVSRGFHGDATVAELRAISGGLPLIITTGEDAARLAARVSQSAGALVVQKPYDIATIGAAVEKALSGPRAA